MTQFLQVLLAGLLLGLVYALVAGGLNLIFGVFQVLNLAHGEFLVIGAFLSWFLWDGLGLHPLLTVPVAAVVLFVVGVATQRLLVERVLKYSIIVSLILLFGLSILLQGLGLQFFGVNDRTIRYFDGSFEIFGVLISEARVVAGLVAIPVLLLMHLHLKYTRMGVATKATAQNAQIAQACGIDVRRVRVMTMGVSAALAGVAGSLLINLYPLNPQAGFRFAIVAFVVAVVGGLGSFYGSILAGLVVGAAEGLVGLYWDPQISIAAVFLVLVAMLAVRPTGLAGVRHA